MDREGSKAEGHPEATPPSNQQSIRNRFATLDPETLVEEYRAAVSSSAHVRSQTGPSRSNIDGRKRQAVLDKADEDWGADAEDEVDFQFDVRSPNTDRRMANKRQNPGPSTKRARVYEPQPISNGGSRRSISLSVRPHQEIGGIRPDDIPLLSQRARAATREHRQPRPPQKRERWKDEDTAALISAIPRYMCAWSEMEGKKLFSTFRTQQQIRDKARNIKVEFLKADDPLPAGFDNVVLGKKEIDAVKFLGRNPSRREGDLDNGGNVTNNIWDRQLEFEQRFQSEEEE